MSNNQNRQETKTATVGIMENNIDAVNFASKVLPKDEFQWFIDNLTQFEYETYEAEPILLKLFTYISDSGEDRTMNKEYYDRNKALFDGLEGDSREAYLCLHEAISTRTPEQLRLMGEFVSLYREELADREACETQLAAIFKDIKTREASNL
ncbi:MAG: hypothetical protein PHW39_02935 [Syntrophomonadaceae bacterium]|nr:hypothetical protein [Clostridia bacterium]MDD4562017.1 hypothetical protein [Syntrophomonadaceae bacterium]